MGPRGVRTAIGAIWGGCPRSFAQRRRRRSGPIAMTRCWHTMPGVVMYRAMRDHAVPVWRTTSMRGGWYVFPKWKVVVQDQGALWEPVPLRSTTSASISSVVRATSTPPIANPVSHSVRTVLSGVTLPRPVASDVAALSAAGLIPGRSTAIMHRAARATPRTSPIPFLRPQRATRAPISSAAPTSFFFFFFEINFYILGHNGSPVTSYTQVILQLPTPASSYET
jgi:hypothetical protein